MGDIAFVIDTLESNRIRIYFERKWYPESLYLLAMLDYLCRENELPLCLNYDDIRVAKLKEPLYPTSVLVMCAALKSEQPKADCYAAAIPEFARHGIIENEVRDVA